MVGQSNVLSTVTPKHVHLFPTVFFQLHLERGGVWMYRVESRPGQSTVVSIHVPDTVL